jgi:ribonuclease R
MARSPTKDEILAWVDEHPEAGAKRDIAKAFGIKGAERIELKRLLKELEAEGKLERRRKSYGGSGKLPPVSVLQISGQTPDGDLLARPVEWQGTGTAPVVLFLPRKGDPALAQGDRILGRLVEVQAGDHAYEARLIRRIGSNPHKVLGIFRKATEGGRSSRVDRASTAARNAPSEWQGRQDARLTGVT